MKKKHQLQASIDIEILKSTPSPAIFNEKIGEKIHVFINCILYMALFLIIIYEIENRHAAVRYIYNCIIVCSEISSSSEIKSISESACQLKRIPYNDISMKSSYNEKYLLFLKSGLIVLLLLFLLRHFQQYFYYVSG